MNLMKNNYFVFSLWLLLFGSLMVYSYFYWPIFWLVMLFLSMSMMLKPPSPLREKWGIWLGTFVPVLISFGLAVFGAK
jgi:hypothetical protein